MIDVSLMLCLYAAILFVFLSTEFVSYREPASAGSEHDNCRVQGHDKIDAMSTAPNALGSFASDVMFCKWLQTD
jgi:hypothetical protein